MRGAALEHPEDRADDPPHRAKLGRRTPVEGRRRREEVAEQLVRAVDQMDDHEGDDTVESRFMKFGLRYANLGRYANGPAAIEDVVVPDGYQSRYPYSPTGRMGSGLEDFPIPDPLVWLSFIASATQTLKLGTAILILPQRNPVVTAKAVASLDHLAGGGRVLLGIGVGWLAEEFSGSACPSTTAGRVLTSTWRRCALCGARSAPAFA